MEIVGLQRWLSQKAFARQAQRLELNSYHSGDKSVMMVCA